MFRNRKQLLSLLALAGVVAAALALGIAHPRLTVQGIDPRDNGVLFAAVTLGALIDSTNPCAISVLFVTLAFMFSLGYERRQVLLTGLSYIAGIYAVYLLIGVGILHVLTLFGMPNFFARFFALVMVVVGALELIGHFNPDFPVKLKIPDAAKPILAKLIERGSYPTGIVLGALVGLFEFPCTGGPYLLVLGLLHTKGELVRGLLYLLYYNLVFVLPLIVVLFLARNVAFMQRLREENSELQKRFRVGLALAMILFGLVLFVVIG